MWLNFFHTALSKHLDHHLHFVQKISKSSVVLGNLSPATQLKSAISSLPVHLSVTQWCLCHSPQALLFASYPQLLCVFFCLGFVVASKCVVSWSCYIPSAWKTWFIVVSHTSPQTEHSSPVALSHLTFSLCRLFFLTWRSWSRIHSNSKWMNKFSWKHLCTPLSALLPQGRSLNTDKSSVIVNTVKM